MPISTPCESSACYAGRQSMPESSPKKLYELIVEREQRVSMLVEAHSEEEAREKAINGDILEETDQRDIGTFDIKRIEEIEP